jgi:toxin ParE1/3/4
MKPVVIHREAIEELDNSVAYYEVQKVGLGLDFLAGVEQALNKIQQNPSLGAVYELPGLRRYTMPKFPFLIFYAELEKYIWVVAIAHGKRKPDYWQKRKIE